MFDPDHADLLEELCKIEDEFKERLEAVEKRIHEAFEVKPCKHQWTDQGTELGNIYEQCSICGESSLARNPKWKFRCKNCFNPSCKGYCGVDVYAHKQPKDESLEEKFRKITGEYPPIEAQKLTDVAVVHYEPLIGKAFKNGEESGRRLERVELKEKFETSVKGYRNNPMNPQYSLNFLYVALFGDMVE